VNAPRATFAFSEGPKPLAGGVLAENSFRVAASYLDLIVLRRVERRVNTPPTVSA
jgi:hypothetical protein